MAKSLFDGDEEGDSLFANISPLKGMSAKPLFNDGFAEDGGE